MNNKDNLLNDIKSNKDDEVKENINNLKESKEQEDSLKIINLANNSEVNNYKKIIIMLLICLLFIIIMTVLNKKQTIDNIKQTNFNQISINGNNNSYDTSSDYSKTRIGNPSVKVDEIDIVDLKIIEDQSDRSSDYFTYFYAYCKFKNNSDKPLSYITMKLNIEGEEVLLMSNAIINSGETSELVSDLFMCEKGVTVNDFTNSFLISARYNIKKNNEWESVDYSHEKEQYSITTRKNSIDSTAFTPSVKMNNINIMDLNIKKDDLSFMDISSIELKIKNNSNRAIKNIRLKYIIDNESAYLYHSEVIESGSTSELIYSSFGYNEKYINYSLYNLDSIEYTIEEEERLIEVKYIPDEDSYSISINSAYEAEDDDYFLTKNNQSDNSYKIKQEDNNTKKLNIKSVKYGKLLDFYQDDGLIVVKTKIEPSYNKKATVTQNGFNIEHIIKENNMDEIEEIQYWAVADMTNSYEEKVVSFTVDKNLINKVKNGNVAGAYIIDEASDVWIHNSLK